MPRDVSDIDALFQDQPIQRNRCKRCGEETAAIVVIGIRKKGRKGRQKSESLSLCAEHALEAFEQAREAIR